MGHKMTDEEVEKFARELLLDISERIEYPVYVDRQVTENGVRFVCLFPTDDGEASIVYKPQKAAEKIVRQCEGMALAGEDHFPAGLMRELLRNSASAAVESLLRNFHREFLEVVLVQPNLAFLSAGTAITFTYDRATAGESGVKPNERRTVEMVDRFVAALSRRRRERLLSSMSEVKKSQEPQTHLLAMFYEETWPAWREAKKRYDLNSDSPHWREIVTASGGDLPLPEDLVERLDVSGGKSDPYDAQPSSIALEHAARLCGVGPNSYKTRTLFHLLKGSKEWMRVTPEDEQADALAKYLHRVYGPEETARWFAEGEDTAKVAEDSLQ